MWVEATQTSVVPQANRGSDGSAGNEIKSPGAYAQAFAPSHGRLGTIGLPRARLRARIDGGDTKERKNGHQTKRIAPVDQSAEAYFSGAVRVEPVFQVGDPVRFNGGSVTFEPGARTAWHTHPLGQTLIITPAAGWCRAEKARRGSPPGRCGLVPPARSTGTAQRQPPP